MYGFYLRVDRPAGRGLLMSEQMNKTMRNKLRERLKGLRMKDNDLAAERKRERARERER